VIESYRIAIYEHVGTLFPEIRDNSTHFESLGDLDIPYFGNLYFQNLV